MKKTIFVLAVSMLIAGTIMTSCQSSDNKVTDARDKVADANKELNQAINDSIQQFKKDAEAKIVANENRIAGLKAKIAVEKKESKAMYEKKLTELEKKNSDMKKKLAQYQSEGESDWKSFRQEFSHDMDELGRAIKDFWVKDE